MTTSLWKCLACGFFLGVAGAGCVERTLTVTSNPPNALVYLNDQEVGRTPFTRRFVWYGTYEAEVRKDGYETVKEGTPVIAPWWQWVPFDFFADVAPVRFKDDHAIHYTLKPVSTVQVDPDSLVERGQNLREQLESSQVRPGPTTRTTRQATSGPATRPTR